jgi:nitroreductase
MTFFGKEIDMQEELSYYDIIFRRKSIRRYDMTPLSKRDLEEIYAKISGFSPLVEGIGYEWAILDAAQVKSLLAIKAPHYLCFYSAAQEDYLVNAGYLMQQAELYLNALGLGCCYLGMAKPNKEIPLEKGGMQFVIMLAFGRPVEEHFRADLSEFKRKPMQEISCVEDGERLVECVRLAPSAVNSQAWYFAGDMRRVDAFRLKKSPLLPLAYDRLRQIDMGIALCHMEVAAVAMGKTIRFFKDAGGAKNLGAGYVYMMSAAIE